MIQNIIFQSIPNSKMYVHIIIEKCTFLLLKIKFVVYSSQDQLNFLESRQGNWSKSYIL